MTPDTVEVLLPSGGSGLAVRTNFGIIVRAGVDGPWRLVCEELYGSLLAVRDRLASDGRLYVAAQEEGLFASDDGGCAWSKARGSLAGLPVLDVAFDPTMSGRLWAVASQSGVGGSVHLSSDGGGTFTLVKFFGTDLQVAQVLVAPSDPRTIYVVARRKTPERVYVEVSKDGGASWAEGAPEGGFPGADVTVLGVSPAAAATLYLGAGGRIGLPDEVWRSDDFGATAHRVLTVQGTQSLHGFAFGATDGTLYVAAREPAPVGDHAAGTLYVSHDGGGAFTPVADGPGYRCLGFRDGLLYACAGGSPALDRFALGASDDEGKTWMRLMDFKDVEGAVACGTMRCSATTTWLCSLGFGACGVVSDGGTDDGGPNPDASTDASIDAAGDGAAPDAVAPGSGGGCGCRVGGVVSTRGGVSPLLSALAAVAALARASRRHGRLR